MRIPRVCWSIIGIVTYNLSPASFQCMGDRTETTFNASLFGFLVAKCGCRYRLGTYRTLSVLQGCKDKHELKYPFNLLFSQGLFPKSEFNVEIDELFIRPNSKMADGNVTLPKLSTVEEQRNRSTRGLRVRGKVYAGRLR